MHSRTHDVSSALQPGANQILLKTGCGAWCPSLAPTCAHSGRMIHTPAGGQPLARLLLTAGSHAVVEYGISQLRRGRRCEPRSARLMGYNVPARVQPPARQKKPFWIYFHSMSVHYYVQCRRNPTSK